MCLKAQYSILPRSWLNLMLHVFHALCATNHKLWGDSWPNPLKCCECLQSSVDVAFWAELGTLKLDKLRLSEEPQQIAGESVKCYGTLLLIRNMMH